jgi:hypothetical protein
MKLIALFIVLGLVAYLTATQMAPNAAKNEINTGYEKHNVELPNIAVDRSDLKEFEQGINTLIQTTVSDIDNKLEDIDEGLNQ